MRVSLTPSLLLCVCCQALHEVVDGDSLSEAALLLRDWVVQLLVCYRRCVPEAASYVQSCGNYRV